MENQVWQRNGGEHFTSSDIPDDDLAVATGAEQDIVGRWVPGEESDSSLVANQLDDWLGKGARKAIISHLPNLDSGIFR